MSVRTIPEKKVVTCDCCRREIGSNGARRAQSGGLHIKRDALDWQGSACASADVKLDLCDDCLAVVCKAINAAAADAAGNGGDRG